LTTGKIVLSLLSSPIGKNIEIFYKDVAKPVPAKKKPG
jgi:hypothetical protein